MSLSPGAQRHREAMREQYRQYAEREKTCTHIPWEQRLVNGVIGGTWRYRCIWCNTLMYDTLWED